MIVANFKIVTSLFEKKIKPLMCWIQVVTANPYPTCAHGIECKTIAHTAVKRGARAQFPSKLLPNKVLNFRNFLLSS